MTFYWQWIPFSSEPLAKFLSTTHQSHYLLPPDPKPNEFIECQIKTIKTALTTKKASGTLIDHLLMTLRSTPVGPNLPSPCEIFHNNIDDHPWLPSRLVDYEQVRNYLMAKKAQQNENHARRHNAWPLSQTRCPVFKPHWPSLLPQRHHNRPCKYT